MPTRTSTIRYVPMLNKLETRFKESRFKMNRLIYMAGVAMAAIAISSCDEDTLTVGNSLTDENDQLDFTPSIFYATTRTLVADSVLSRSSKCYLGRVRDPETFNDARITSEFTTQFHLLETFYISPEEYIQSRTTNNRAKADSCDIVLFLSSPFRLIDSLASMKMQVLEMSKATDYQKLFYTNFDPVKEGYIRTDGIKKSHMFTYKNYQVLDTLGQPSATVRILLNDPYTDKNGVTYPNYGTYILQQQYDHPEYFRNSYTLAQNVCPGFFFRITDGEGYYSQVKSMALRVYYGVQKPDTTFRAAITLAGTSEVKQTSLITNDPTAISQLASNDDCTYIKTPAGLFTEVTLPITQIRQGHENDSLLAAKIIFQRLNYESSDPRMLGIPSALVMVRKDSLNAYFEHQSVPDNKKSFFTLYNSTNNTYTFANISPMISNLWNERQRGLASNPNWDAEHPNWNKVVLVPVTYTTSSTSTQPTRVDHDMSLTSTRLVGGANHPLEMSVVYAKFK